MPKKLAVDQDAKTFKFQEPQLGNKKPAIKNGNPVRTAYYDTSTTGLSLRISADGKRRSFSLLYRVRGQSTKQRITLGEYPSTSLKEARALADTYLEEARARRDPRETIKEAQEAEAKKREADAVAKAKAMANTFAAVAEEYLAAPERTSKRSHKAEASKIRRHLVPRWGAKPITEIERDDVVDMVRAIAKTNPHEARYTLSNAKTLFAWVVDQKRKYGVERSPCDGVSAKKLIGTDRLKPRKRVLTDDELRRMWHASLRLPYPWGDFVRLQLLSGTRLREAAHAHANEIDTAAKTWTIQAGRTKTDAAHVVPYSSAIADIFAAVPAAAREAFLFSTDAKGRQPIEGFGKAKDKLDLEIARGFVAETEARPGETLTPLAKVGKAVRIVANGHMPFAPQDAATKTNKGRVIGLRQGTVWGFAHIMKFVSKKEVIAATLPGAGFAAMKPTDTWLLSVEHFTNHDLRRTMRTRLSKLRVPGVVKELLIGHKQQGLDAVYDQYEYELEMREALQKWADYLARIVDPPRGENVVHLHAGREAAGA